MAAIASSALAFTEENAQVLKDLDGKILDEDNLKYVYKLLGILTNNDKNRCETNRTLLGAINNSHSPVVKNMDEDVPALKEGIILNKKIGKMLLVKPDPWHLQTYTKEELQESVQDAYAVIYSLADMGTPQPYLPLIL